MPRLRSNSLRMKGNHVQCADCGDRSFVLPAQKERRGHVRGRGGNNACSGIMRPITKEDERRAA